MEIFSRLVKRLVKTFKNVDFTGFVGLFLFGSGPKGYGFNSRKT